MAALMLGTSSALGCWPIVGHGRVEPGVVHGQLVSQPAAPAEAHGSGAAVAVGPGAQVVQRFEVVVQVFHRVELPDELAALVLIGWGAAYHRQRIHAQRQVAASRP
jgi:hypothetical protein